jgi:hypothetical protein
MATTPEEIDRRNRNQQLALVAGGLVVLLVVLWFLFLRGNGSDDTTQPITTSPTAAASPTPEPAKAPKPPKGAVETFEVFAPKDPFDPLVTEGGGGGGTTQGTTGDTTGVGGSAAPSGGGGESVGGHRVRLVDVFTQNGRQRAQVQVDGTVYTVDEGETFAESFQLMSISGECATMLFGDDQFTLCEGEEILK